MKIKTYEAVSSEIVHIRIHRQDDGGSFANRSPSERPGVEDEIAASPRPCRTPMRRHAKGQEVRFRSLPVFVVVVVGHTLHVEEVGGLGHESRTCLEARPVKAGPSSGGRGRRRTTRQGRRRGPAPRRSDFAEVGHRPDDRKDLGRVVAGSHLVHRLVTRG